VTPKEAADGLRAVEHLWQHASEIEGQRRPLTAAIAAAIEVLDAQAERDVCWHCRVCLVPPDDYGRPRCAGCSIPSPSGRRSCSKSAGKIGWKRSGTTATSSIGWLRVSALWCESSAKRVRSCATSLRSASRTTRKKPTRVPPISPPPPSLAGLGLLAASTAVTAIVALRFLERERGALPVPLSMVLRSRADALQAQADKLVRSAPTYLPSQTSAMFREAQMLRSEAEKLLRQSAEDEASHGAAVKESP